MGLRRMLLVFLMTACPLGGSAVSAHGPEIIADTPAAIDAGFRILELRSRPDDEHSETVHKIVAEFARSQGVTRPVNTLWAPIRLLSGQVLLAVTPLGAEFEIDGARGGRLLVYAVGRNVTAKLILDTTAVAAGVDDHGTIAAIDENGLRRFVWNGLVLQQVP
jgi:hypothetical protein